MTTTGVGQAAEKAVAEFLIEHGYKILARNWRTRWCEIDLIAQKADTIYFVEVKYRGHHAQGSGFEHIGPHKIRQLEFAVNFWNAHNGWEGDCRLIAAEVSGINFDQIKLTEMM